MRLQVHTEKKAKGRKKFEIFSQQQNKIFHQRKEGKSGANVGVNENIN